MRKLIFVLPILLVLFACKKKGCMDAYADNYSSENEKEDKSCLYSASFIVWMDSTTAVHLNTAGHNSVKVSVGGNQSGQYYTSNYTNHAPTCGDTMGYEMRIGLGEESLQKVSYTISTIDGTAIKSGDIELDATKCKIVNFTY